MPAILLAWKELRRNTLLGFATVQLGALKIHDVTLHQQNGKRWVGLPAKPLINAAEDRTMKDIAVGFSMPRCWSGPARMRPSGSVPVSSTR
jgi:hypothetical protein